jgi:hypothetical protein
MCVFQLKNFAGDDYKDKQEHAVIDNGPVQFEDVTPAVDQIRSRISSIAARLGTGECTREPDEG